MNIILKNNKNKKRIIASTGEDVEKVELSYTAVKCAVTVEKILEVSQIIKHSYCRTQQLHS